MSASVQPHRRQPTRLPHPWDSQGKNTGVGCHFLLQSMKVKSLSHVWLLETLEDKSFISQGIDLRKESFGHQPSNTLAHIRMLKQKQKNFALWHIELLYSDDKINMSESLNLVARCWIMNNLLWKTCHFVKDLRYGLTNLSSFFFFFPNLSFLTVLFPLLHLFLFSVIFIEKKNC